MHYTIIPIKSLKDGKKRLESFLTSSERKELILALLHDVLNAATESKLSDHVLLITHDPEIIESTLKWNLPKLKFLLEPTAQGTNEAVQFALNWSLSEGASSILIIPADIPLIKASDIDDLIELGHAQNSIILVPSQRKDGTNAVFMKPPNLVGVWYGIDSFQKNIKTIVDRNIPYKILENPSFALDIDLKEDLELLQSVAREKYSSHFKKSINL